LHVDGTFRRLLIALGLLVLVVMLTPVTFWWATALAGPWDDPKGDLMIVLTGSMLDEHTIGTNSYWRAVYAARAFKEDGFEEILISGGNAEPGAIPAAVAMRDFVVFEGVPAERVRTETESGSTVESARNITRLLYGQQAKRLVLLSSDYHMYRAHRAFQKQGLRVLPRPIPDARKRYGSFYSGSRWAVFLDVAGETAKILYYAARGWI
jgi:uncharacterized SAM-binding protein YcdF (DUF218 family)